MDDEVIVQIHGHSHALVGVSLGAGLPRFQPVQRHHGDPRRPRYRFQCQPQFLTVPSEHRPHMTCGGHHFLTRGKSRFHAAYFTTLPRPLESKLDYKK